MNKIIMTEELRNKLIDHYENVLRRLNSKWFKFICYFLTSRYELRQIKQVLRSTYTGSGVCYAANLKFQTNIFKCRWINSHIPTSGSYWCKVPIQAASPDEAKKLLQIRIDILKSYPLINTKLF